MLDSIWLWADRECLWGPFIWTHNSSLGPVYVLVWGEGNYNYLDCYSHCDTEPETDFHSCHTMSDRRLERVNFFTDHLEEDYCSFISLDTFKSCRHCRLGIIIYEFSSTEGAVQFEIPSCISYAGMLLVEQCVYIDSSDIENILWIMLIF
jgi:hypothetical protein